MKTQSGFIYTTSPGGTGGMQLMGLAGSMPYPDAGLPPEKQFDGHVRGNIISNKPNSSVSYVRIIADDIRKRDRDAKSGGWFGKQWTNYYSQFGYNPYRVAQALHDKTGLMPANVQHEDIKNDERLAGQITKLENHFGITVSGSGGGGGGGGNGSSGGNGSGGNGSGGNGSSNGTGSSFSIPGVSSGNTMLWVLGGVGVLGALVLLKGK